MRSAILCLGFLCTVAAAGAENFMVPMSDGTRLNTEVDYPPEGSGPWPVLLYRTPYNIVYDNIGWAAEEGFVGVSQDTRGRYGSEGLDRMFRDDGWGPDHTDGLDTVHWILAQSWCDGNIGTFGGSARGITQNMLAGALPESVGCLFVVVAPADMYAHCAFPGGAFRQYDMEQWLTAQGSVYMIDSLYAHPNDDDWWGWLNTKTRHPLETIPTYQIGGWFGLFLQGAIDSFTGLQYGGGSGARGNQKLIVGPWTHNVGQTHVGELEFPDAELDPPAEMIGDLDAWFERWIRGIPNGIMELPPIAYYVMGDCSDPEAPGNEWRTAHLWPPPAAEVSYYLRADGLLSETPPGNEEPESFAYDPLDPVPTLGGGNLLLDAGPYDQRPVLTRPDVLVFQTEPLAEPVEVAGPVRVEIFAASDRLDTDFTAKLCDVYPDGRAMLICDGILRARHRNGMESEELMVPGEIYAMTIDLWETAIIFNSGHRIMLAISSSNHPRFDVNPNTGEPFMQHTTTLVATNTVYHEAGFASRLVVCAPLPPQDVVLDLHPIGPSLIEDLRVGPNPVTQSAQIAWHLSRPAPVEVTLYDLAGRLLHSTIVPGERGQLTWDGRDQVGHPLPSGTYILQLRTGSAHVRRTLRIVR